MLDAVYDLFFTTAESGVEERGFTTFQGEANNHPILFRRCIGVAARTPLLPSPPTLTGEVAVVVEHDGAKKKGWFRIDGPPAFVIGFF